MNLLQLRTKLIQLSGRFDLAIDPAGGDYTDNGADFFIYEGQKHLDRMNETQKSWASKFCFIETNRFSATFPYCRAIKEVWAATTSERWQLDKMDYADLITEYMTELPSERESGTPLYYSPIITRYIPEDATADIFEAFVGWVDIPSGNAHEYNGIVINVPTDEKLLVEVKGFFYSMQLEAETDKNYWSEVHPGLLIMAAQRMMEVFNRNTQGVNDWDNAIATYDTQLGMDLVEELIAEVNQIEG